MSNIITLKFASNHVFEAHDDFDGTKRYFLMAFRDEEDTGVNVEFLDPADENGRFTVRDNMWLTIQQCEEFGNGLLEAARICRLSGPPIEAD